MKKRVLPVLLGVACAVPGCASPSADTPAPSTVVEESAPWSEPLGLEEALLLARPRPGYAPVTPGYEGTVAIVDDANDICVVSAGPGQGARAGDIVTISRDGRFVAEVMLLRMLSEGACAMPTLDRGVPLMHASIRVGDRVSTPRRRPVMWCNSR